MRFRKKPVVIEASEWWQNGDHPEDYAHEVVDVDAGIVSPQFQEENKWEGQIVRYYRRPDDPGERLCHHCHRTMHEHGWIDTLEGGHVVCPGDWIITGIKGERYPCKPDIFFATYDPVIEPAVTRKLPPQKPTLRKLPFVAPPKVYRVTQDRSAVFRARMQAAGVDDAKIDSVLDELVELGSEIIGESKWWHRGRKAVGIFRDVIEILRGRRQS